MFRVLLLILILPVAAVFAQTVQPAKAVKFDEFTAAANNSVKTRLQAFLVELGNNPASQGYIINYGTDGEITARESQIREAIRVRRFDAQRVTLMRGGFGKTVRTEFWVVPDGAEKPVPKSSGEKIDEFTLIPDGDLKARLDNYFVTIANNSGAHGMILIYGTPQAVRRQESRMKRYIALRRFDASKITFKNAGAEEKVKTEFWIIKEGEKDNIKTRLLIVPPGAKPPTQ
jgi:hypothetical protein